ncbi:MAG: ABC transporter permease [Chloroflexi bacterium]|nr:ABC transporter permease [Chloroflexota bacterium]
MATDRAVAAPAALAGRRPRAGFRRMLRVGLGLRLGVFGLVVIVVVSLLALFAPWVAPFAPEKTDFSLMTAPPGSLGHLMGTDIQGRDVFSRLVYGSRVSLLVGVIAVGIAILAGVPIGLFAGFMGGFVDDLLMRVMDTLYSFPTILLALVIVAVLQPGLVNVMVAVGITSIPLYARLVRGSTLSVRETDYVTAAKAIGARSPRILALHIWPNVSAPILVQGSLGMAFAVLAEASLSFLGLGVPPPTPTWGGMLRDGFSFIDTAWWLSVFPGLAIFFLVLAFNFVGDALRDALDPRLAHSLGSGRGPGKE